MFHSSIRDRPSYSERVSKKPSENYGMVSMKNEELTKYLKHMCTFFEAPMCPLERFILECGEDYIPAKRPKGVRKQADKMCFRNATQLALSNRDLEYVEGFAVNADIGFPLMHAWCVDKADKVIDVTWRKPEGSMYRGVIIPRYTLLIQLVKNNFYGLLDNGITINMDLIGELRSKMGC